MMIHALTEFASKGAKPSIKPFRDFLFAGHPLDERFRKLLLELTDDKGRHGVRLTIERTRGRKRTTQEHQSDMAAYEYYDDLLGTRITRELVVRYARAIGAPPITLANERVGKATRITYLVDNGTRTRKLVKGASVPDYVALALTALKFHKSADALRKTFATLERAKSNILKK